MLSGTRRRKEDKEMSDTTANKEQLVPPYVQALIDSGVPIDRGWAWVVCFAAFVLHALISGLTRASGIIFMEVAAEFGSSKTETSVLITVFIMCAVLSSPVANALSQRLSPRFVILIGGAFTSVGIALSSFTRTLPTFIIVFSGLGGSGYGFLFTPSIAVVSQYFYRRRSLAVGISMCGGGFGALIIPPLVVYLIKFYSFRGMLFIIGAVYLNSIASASLMRPFKFYIRHSDPTEVHRLLHPKQSTSAGGSSRPALSTVSRCCRRIAAEPLFRNPRLYICSLAMSVMTEGLPISYMVLPPMAADIGLTRGQITTILLVMGIPDIVGRVSIGWLADKDLLRRWQLVTIIAAVEAAIWTGVTFLLGFEGLLVFAIAMGVAGGAILTLFGPVMADAVGIDKINVGLGFAMLLKVLMFPVPILLGYVRDVTGKWIWSYRLLTLLLFVAVLVMLLNKCVTVRREAHSLSEDAPDPEEIEMDPIVDRIVEK